MTFLALCAALAFSSQSGPSADADIEALEQLTEARLETVGGVGAVFTLIDDTAIAATRAFGEVTPGGEAMSAEHVFAAASMTKPLIALAILQLEADGRIELDAPAVHYLPWMTGPDPEITGRISVRDLMNHRSGYSRAAGLRNGLLSGDAPRLDPDRFQDHVNRTAPVHEPGSVFEYSNLNYHLLGQILEAASGQAYEDVVRARILEPLDLTGSAVNALPADHAYAGQHRMIFGRPAALLEPRAMAGAAGGLFTTAQDYARFLIAVASEDPAIMPAGALERILAEPTGSYRLGWQILESDAHGVILYHNGWALGGSSTAAIAPATGRGFVAFANAAEGYVANDIPTVTDHPRALAFGMEYGAPRQFWLQRAVLAVVVLILLAHIGWIIQLVRGPARHPGIGPAAASAVQAGLGAALPMLTPRLFAGDFAAAFDLYPGAALVMAATGGAIMLTAFARVVRIRPRAAERA